MESVGEGSDLPKEQPAAEGVDGDSGGDDDALEVDSSVPDGMQSPRTEVADLRAAMMLMESSAADELRAERQKHINELANLHQLLAESQEEAQGSRVSLERERQDWSRTQAVLSKEVESLQGQNTALLESELAAARTEVTKLKKRLEKAVEGAGPQAVTLAALLGVDDVNAANDESLKELERMNFQHCPVADLQMYMMALVTQKRLLQEDNKKLEVSLQQAQEEVMTAKAVPSSQSISPLPADCPSGRSSVDSALAAPFVAAAATDFHCERQRSSSSVGILGKASGQNDGDLSAKPPARSSSASDIFLAEGVDNGRSTNAGGLAQSAEDLVDLTSAGQGEMAMHMQKMVLALRAKVSTLSAQLTDSRTMCSNYEVQLQQAQGGSQLALAKQKDLEQQLDKCAAEINGERGRLQRFEETSRRLNEEHQQQLGLYARQQGALASAKSQLVDDFGSLREECRQQVDAIIDAKDKVAFELAEMQAASITYEATATTQIADLKAELETSEKRLTEANECLSQVNKDVQQQHSVNEENQRDLRTQLEETNEKLRSEQLCWHDSEHELKLQLVQAESERGDARVQLATERRTLEQLRHQHKDLELQMTNLQGRSKEVIVALQTQLEDRKAEKTACEEKIVALRGQLENMRQQLDSSQSVQQDFVRLSQNLQLQLANMVDKQRELRWEHEDDVDTCRSCQKLFSVTRRKHHCRQCGKIFCNECSSKTVPGGQSQRAMRVCDGCYAEITTDSPMQFAMDKTL